MGTYNLKDPRDILRMTIMYAAEEISGRDEGTANTEALLRALRQPAVIDMLSKMVNE